MRTSGHHVEDIYQNMEANDACVMWGEAILKAKCRDWTIKFSPGASPEGVCILKTQTIAIHWPDGEPDYPLMLHEIAHITAYGWGHDSAFAHEYMALVREFFVAKGAPDE